MICVCHGTSLVRRLCQKPTIQVPFNNVYRMQTLLWLSMSYCLRYQALTHSWGILKKANEISRHFKSCCKCYFQCTRIETKRPRLCRCIGFRSNTEYISCHHAFMQGLYGMVPSCISKMQKDPVTMVVLDTGHQAYCILWVQEAISNKWIGFPYGL